MAQIGRPRIRSRVGHGVASGKLSSAVPAGALRPNLGAPLNPCPVAQSRPIASAQSAVLGWRQRGSWRRDNRRLITALKAPSFNMKRLGAVRGVREPCAPHGLERRLTAPAVALPWKLATTTPAAGLCAH